MFFAKNIFLDQTKVAFLNEEKQPFAFALTRGSDINYGDIYQARVLKKMPKLKAYFLDINRSESVFLPSAQELEEGQSITVEITAEARPGKTAACRLCTQQMEGLPRLLQKGLIETDGTEIPWNETYDEAFEQALRPILTVADGAEIIFERTTAFWSIDVDSAKSDLPLSQINLQAATAIGKEIILRNLSGNLIIDFIGKKRKDELAKLLNILRFELDKSSIPFQIMGISPIGNVEIRRDRHRATLIDSASTLSATAYRLLEEALKTPSYQLQINVPPELYKCLQTDLVDTLAMAEVKKGAKFSFCIDTKEQTYQIKEVKNG